MSWSPIKPLDNRREPRPVRVGAVQKSLRHKAGLVITVLPAHLHGLDFMSPGTMVEVLLGAGEHAGMLRVQPNGPVRVAATGGKNGRGGAVLLRVSLPPGISACKHEPEVVEHDYGDGWLELTLPDWARLTGLPARSAEVTAPRPAYSLADRVPDPAAALRGHGGRR